VGPLYEHDLPGEIRPIKISIILTMQNKGCRAMKSTLRLLTLAFALGFLDSPLRTVQAADNPAVVRISSTLTRTSDTVGQLSVTADITSGFHIYAQSQPRPFLATKITMAESPVVRVTRTFTPSRPPKSIRHPTLGVELHEYEGQVTWTALVEFSRVPTAEVVVQGTVIAQACQEDRCLAPKTYEFMTPLRTDSAPSHGGSAQGVAVAEAGAPEPIGAPLAHAGAQKEARPTADRGPSSGSFSLEA
jgi:Disulphide bond corrector protein DsbC